MKKKLFIVVIALILSITACFALTSCADNNSSSETLRFSAPEGTPALAMLRLTTDNKTIAGKNMTYAVVNPANIVVEMSNESSDVVIMPINAGANLISKGAQYKLVSVAVDGSLFMVGKKENAGTIEFEDLIGKTVACIGKAAVPGMVFRYVMNASGLILIEEGTPNADNNEVKVQYVADGNAAKTLLAGENADFAVVGEPAATAFKGALQLNAEMNMQTAYADITGKGSYPQAGLFVKKALAENETFMDALFDALKASKDWALANPTEVTAFAKANLYESAAFPAPSIARCAINVGRMNDNTKSDIVTFLNAVARAADDWSTVDLF